MVYMLLRGWVARCADERPRCYSCTKSIVRRLPPVKADAAEYVLTVSGTTGTGEVLRLVGVTG